MHIVTSLTFYWASRVFSMPRSWGLAEPIPVNTHLLEEAQRQEVTSTAYIAPTTPPSYQRTPERLLLNVTYRHFNSTGSGPYSLLGPRNIASCDNSFGVIVVFLELPSPDSTVRL